MQSKITWDFTEAFTQAFFGEQNLAARPHTLYEYLLMYNFTVNWTSTFASPVVKFLSNLTLVYPPVSVASTSSKLLTESFGGADLPVLQ